MKKHSLLIFFIALLFLAGPISSAHAAEMTGVLTVDQQIQALLKQIELLKQQIAQLIAEQQINAGSYLTIDITSGSRLSEKNAGQTYPIASITKLMNAVVTVENTDLNQTVTLKEEMLTPLGYSPSLFLGLNVSVKNLLKASLIQSTNDAAEALSYAGEQTTFVQAMNEKAKKLGMQDTHFYDAHGLNPLNISTVTDLAKLITYIYQTHPEILNITKDNDFWLPDPTGKMLKFKNLNSFYSLSEFIGGKTGFLTEARQSLASLFNVNGKPVAVILLYSKNREADTLKILDNLRKN